MMTRRGKASCRELSERSQHGRLMFSSSRVLTRPGDKLFQGNEMKCIHDPRRWKVPTMGFKYFVN